MLSGGLQPELWCEPVNRLNRNQSLSAACGAFLTEIGFNLVAGNGLHPSAFQVVMTAVENNAHLIYLVEVSGHRVLNETVSPASTLRSKGG
jgi:hypothetical protein